MDQGISRKHAQITKIADKVFITDLGSSNGTLVNDKKLPPKEPKELAKEDMIKLGNSILKFLPQGELETLFYGNLGLAANTDPLTKTYNKRYLLEALDAEFKRAKALHSDFSLLFLDLDHFKKVNDTFGHDAGDFVLREFSQLIRSQYLRPKDIFARYGGEEFVVLMGNTSAAVGAEVAEKMRASIELHAFIYEGKRIPVTSSMGLCELQTGIESAQTLLKMADQALYEAKNSGRNRLVVSNG
jgi:two-component system, cell cycle response regulator